METRGHRLESWHVFSVVFFFCFFFVCVEGFIHFLNIVAKGSSAFPK